MTVKESVQFFLYPLISTPGWFIGSALCLIGSFFFIHAARGLYGSDVYWSEIPWYTRVFAAVAALLFSVLPLVNYVYLTYLVYLYIAGWMQYRERERVKRTTFNKHHYATRNPDSPRAQPVRAAGEAELRIVPPESKIKISEFREDQMGLAMSAMSSIHLVEPKVQWDTPDTVLERFVTNVMNAMRQSLRDRIGLPQTGSRNQVRDRLLTLPKAQVEEIYKDAIIDLTLLNPLAGKHYGSAELVADTEAAFAARVDYLALLASAGYYVTVPEGAAKNHTEYIAALRRRYPDIK